MSGAPQVCIVGGGLVGISCALALRSVLPAAQLGITLLESHPLAAPAQKSGPDLDARSTAISWGTREIFSRLGLWPELQTAACPILDIHVSESGRFGVTRLSASECGVAALGYVLENAVLGRALLGALRARGDITVHAPVEVSAVRPVGGRQRVETRPAADEAATGMDADLVIVCDGGRSGLCASLGLQTDTVDYSQHAVVFNVVGDRPHDHVAYERFAADGPMALLPLPGDRRAVICTLAPERAAAWMAADDTALARLLGEAFGKRLGRVREIGRRASHPLQLQCVREQARPGLLVLGNAAHTLHPVAGQGFNLSMRDTDVLVRVICRALERGESPGALATLNAYLEARLDEQGGVIGFTHGLVRVFSRQLAALGPARSGALLTLDLLSPARQLLARHAMGVA